MSQYMKKFIFFIFLIQTAEGFLSVSETLLLVSLTKARIIRNCVLSPETPADVQTAELLKVLSEERKVLTVHVKQENLGKFIEKMDSRLSSRVAVILKESNPSTKSFFRQKTAAASFLWIVFDPTNGTLKQDLLKIYIPYNCLFFFVEKLNDNHYIVYEIYNVKKWTPGIVKAYAEWEGNSLKLLGGQSSIRRRDMLGHNFTTVKFNEELYLTPKDKINEEIWRDLSVLLNFSIVEKVVEYSIQNGPLELSAEKEEEAFLDTQIYIGSSQNSKTLLGPTSESKLFMHVRVSGEDKRFTRFLKPFSPTTWMSILLWVSFSGFCIFLAECIFGKVTKNKARINELHLTLFIPIHSLCNQSGTEVSKNITSRFLLFLIRISGVVVYYAYSATFISYLLLYIPELPFTDLKGFVEDGRYKIEGERNSDVDTFFSVSPDPLEKLVYEKYFSDIRRWSRFDKGVDRMCAGEKLVLIGYDNDIDKYMPCHIVKIKKPLKTFANGFKIKFRSPYKEIFHIKLSQLRTSGILQHVNDKIIFANIRKFRMEHSYELKLVKVIPAFILLGFGICVSVIILAFEKMVKELKSRKNKEDTEKMIKFISWSRALEEKSKCQQQELLSKTQFKRLSSFS